MIGSSVAIGGGHGTSATLEALLKISTEVTGVVSVADDGGSSGRLRELFDVVAYGDIRKCLVALSPDAPIARSFSRRFTAGELEGHVLGTLILAGLVDEAGGLVEGLVEAGALLGARGRIFPASVAPVTLIATSRAGIVEGQVAVASSGPIGHISVEPQGVESPSEALRAIAQAELLAMGPGSLFTSVLAALAVPQISRALKQAQGLRVFIANLRDQVPETEGFGLVDQLEALEAHEVLPELVLADSNLQGSAGRFEAMVHFAQLTSGNPFVHDPALLAGALEQVAGMKRSGSSR